VKRPGSKRSGGGSKRGSKKGSRKGSRKGGGSPWLHSGLSKEAAERLLTTAGLDDGRFLVRRRAGVAGEYVLSVVYKGAPTHHLVAKGGGDDGALVINKKSYGSHNKTIRDLVKTLSKKGPGWPVALDKPVFKPGAAADDGAAAVVPAVPATIAEPATATAAVAGGGKPVEEAADWLHGPMAREAADKVLTDAGLDDGRFFVRTRAGVDNQYVVAVVFRGKPTHHLVTKGSDGTMLINKQPVGSKKTIADLVQALSKKQPGWPVALDKPVLKPGF
jgi:hypothetical protein